MATPESGLEQSTQPVDDSQQQPGEQPQADEKGFETVPELMGEEKAPELNLSPDEYEQQINAFKTKSEDEVSKRQQVERERDYYLQLLAQAQQHMGKGKDEQPEFSDEDIVDVATMKKMVQQMIEQSIQQPSAAFQQTLTKMSINQARLAHDDYDDVYKLCDDLVKNDPTGRIFSFIQNSPDPGEEIYRIGKTHNDYVSGQVNKAGKKVAQTIQKNSNKPPTLSDMGAVGNRKTDAVKRIQNWSVEETEAEISRVLNGV